ncbi:L-asparagine operon repressor OS=Streptomyces glaucescens OX=1907 GN=SGLAU_03285 PE=4 SV=1 [Streptomyces glaucescens]
MNLSDSQTAVPVPRRVGAMEAVLGHLRGAIERGEYAIGDKLPSEAELCRTLEVSRPVLREALRALQALGLTVAKTGKGTFVVADSVEDPTFGDYAASDLLEVRLARRDPGRRVRGAAPHPREPRPPGPSPRPHGAGARHHRVGGDGHPLPSGRGRGRPEPGVPPGDRGDPGRPRPPVRVPERAGRPREQSNREHRAIVEALIDGSEHDAVEAMSHHLDRVETTLTDIVRPARTDTPTEGGPEA